MKKIYGGLLLVIIIILLTGCNNISKEDMINKSTKLDLHTLTSDLDSNYKNAKEKYENNIYSITAGVISVEEKYAKIELYTMDDVDDYLEVHFNDSDLNQLKAGQKIEFVGKIKNITKKGEYENYIINISNAYYLTDVVEISGIIEAHYGLNTCSLSLINYWGDEDNDEYTTYELDKVISYGSCYKTKIKGTELKDGDNITIKGKVIETDNDTADDDDWTITEIESIKVKK